ncbi:MAG: LytR C-terminal domain-containing protein [Melioribacteraceae bacterium]|nr:LytR C-terminal domain-containing protein [Melioribacteraceae bacterium]
MEKKTVKKTTDGNNKKSSVINILLNISIFILTAIIIYMLYSIFVKFNFGSDKYVISENKEVASEIIQVDVLNGCGVGGVADRFTDFLRTKNVDVVGIKNYISFDVDETMVVDRTGNEANAKRIANLLGIKNDNIITQLNKDYFIDVSIIVGRDYFNLTPFK